MRFGDKLAVHIAPIFLRLALAVTFIWAGWGKLGVEVEMAPQQAAILANMGAFTPDTAPYLTPDTAPSDEGALPDPSDGTPDEGVDSAALRPFAPTIVQVVQEAAPAEAEERAETAPPTPTYVAADFDGPIEVRRLHELALLIHARAQPTTREDGTTTSPIVPSWAAEGNRPLIAAWLGAVTEFVAGALLVIGLFSRLCGLALAGTMVVAAALTTVGPAIQAGTTTLGFIPNSPSGMNWYEPAAYSTLLWQFAVFCAGMAVFFTGSGALAIERVFRKKSLGDDGDDDDE